MRLINTIKKSIFDYFELKKAFLELQSVMPKRKEKKYNIKLNYREIKLLKTCYVLDITDAKKLLKLFNKNT